MQFNKLEKLLNNNENQIKDKNIFLKELYQLRDNNYSDKELFDFIFNKIENTENVQEFSKKDIEDLFMFYIGETKNENISPNILNYFGSAIINYLSNKNKLLDGEDSILDFSYKTYYKLAEKYPEELKNMIQTTNSMQEFVSPEVFFDTFLKIKNSEVLNTYFGGDQFHQLEYNMTYNGTEDYLNTLLNKIDFNNSNSCNNSSKLINIAAVLADDVKNGFYHGNYNIDQKIIQKLKSKCDDPESIYLLGSKSRYIINRLEQDYPPFVHNNKIFKITPNTLAIFRNNKLYTLDIQNKDILDDYENYLNLSNELDTPPQELINEAIKRGDNFLTWSPDQSLIFLRKQIVESIFNKMVLFDEKSLNNKNLNQSQIQEFINLMGTDYRNFIEDEFNINLENFSIEEKFYFLDYIQKQTNKTIVPVKEFIKNFTNSGFRTFLSIEHGGKEMGDKILELGEKLPKEIAEKVFDKYSEIVSSLDEQIASIKNKLKTEKNITEEDELAVKNNFLNRAKNVLLKAFDNLEKNPEKILEDLDKVNIDNLSLLSIFQSLKNTQNLKFEDLKDFEFYLSYDSAEFVSFEELAEMENIIDKNYKSNPEILKIIKNSLSGRVLNGYNWVEIPILKYKGKIVAFCSLDFGYYQNTPDFSKKVYFNSFNVDPDFANGEIGQAMLDRVLNQTSLKQIIEADCNAVSKIGAHYIEFGFFAKDFYDFHGWPSFKIEKNDKVISSLLGKNISNETIINNSNTGFVEINNKKAFIKKERNQEDFQKYFENLEKENKIVTRYFYDKNTDYWYIVIENFDQAKE